MGDSTPERELLKETAARFDETIDVERFLPRCARRRRCPLQPCPRFPGAQPGMPLPGGLPVNPPCSSRGDPQTPPPPAIPEPANRVAARRPRRPDAAQSPARPATRAAASAGPAADPRRQSLVQPTPTSRQDRRAAQRDRQATLAPRPHPKPPADQPKTKIRPGETKPAPGGDPKAVDLTPPEGISERARVDGPSYPSAPSWCRPRAASHGGRVRS